MKKAQSMSFHTIIVAVLAIIVLVVVLFLVLRTFKGTNSGTDCPSKGGYCANTCNAPYTEYSGEDDVVCPNDKTCCVLNLDSE